MGDLQGVKSVKRSWLQPSGVHYGGAALGALTLSVLLARPAASEWPPEQNEIAALADVAHERCVRQSSRSTSLEQTACARSAGLADPGEPSLLSRVERARVELAFHGYGAPLLRLPNGLLEVDTARLLERANSRAVPALSAFGALRRSSSPEQLTQLGCDLGSGRSGVDSVFSALAVLALAALGMRFRA